MSTTKNTVPAPLNLRALLDEVRRREEERDALFEEWVARLHEEVARVKIGHDPIFLERRIEEARRLLDAERARLRALRKKAAVTARILGKPRTQGVLEERSASRSTMLRTACRHARAALRGEYGN